MGNPDCPICLRDYGIDVAGLKVPKRSGRNMLKVKKISGTRYWVCSKNHRFKVGTSLDHLRFG